MINRKRTSFLIPFVLLLFVFFLPACSNNEANHDEASDYDMATDNSDDGFVVTEEEETISDEPEEASDIERMETKSNEQMVIYNGYISIEVNDFNDAQHHIQDEVEKINGFVVESTVYQRGEDEELGGNLTVRVPKEYFQSFLNDLETTSSKVLEKSTTGNDVTEEYVDLESSLRSKETVEERLLTFLEEAESTEDLLSISNDLSDVQEDIERIKGRIAYLENHVAFSTITIDIQERKVNVSSLQDREALNTFQHAQSLFMDTVNVIISVFSHGLVLIIGLSPVLVPLAIIGVGIYLIQKRRRKSDTKQT
ncbi:DUF4349 domain-containing protein [Salipaludibacillus daqingensis]|uniref:DUF4349 domain-containing protein n=1 Tax=Salipaludibacillus daqingensis TaxID=3041001 RepID=UPI0024733D42|nr:DUF4349 domain-containing protein [Salipaludibacillus daqingensis]